MFKRVFDFGFFEEPSRKYHKLTSPDSETETNDQLSPLPTELIINILSYLNDTGDILNCLLISKRIRNIILSCPKLMQNFNLILRFQTHLFDFSSVKKFIGNNGINIRQLTVEISEKQTEYFGKIIDLVHKMPNLEELLFDFEEPVSNPFSIEFREREEELEIREARALKNRFVKKEPEEDDDNFDEEAELTKLKHLQIRFQDLQKLIRKVKNLKSLEKLAISIKEFKNQSVLVDLLNKFEKLQDLRIVEDEEAENIMSESEIANILGLPENDVKLEIKLKKIAIYFQSECDMFIAKFIENQVDNLEELEFSYEPDADDFGYLWSKFKKLRRLRIESLEDDEYRSLVEDFDDIQMDTVKCFETWHFKELSQNVVRFPNLEIFKCSNFVAENEIFDKITTLEIQFAEICEIMTAKFPNLKNFSITKKVDPDAVTNVEWVSFCRNIPNVENVSLNFEEEAMCDVCVFDCLPIFTKLKKFQYRHELDGRTVPYFDKIEFVPVNFEFYKVLVDTDKKIVKVCHFIVDNDMKILRKLYENFSNFEFTEFCYRDPERSKKKMTFDPEETMRTRTRLERSFPHKNRYREVLPICSHCYPEATPSDLVSDSESENGDMSEHYFIRSDYDERSEDDDIYGFGAIY